MTGRETSWAQKPRRPLPFFASGGLFWCFVIFWLGVAFLVGLGVIIGEEAWWAKVCGGAGSAATLALSGALVTYLRRPVREIDPAHVVDESLVNRWADELRRHGHVEIGLSPGKVARTVLVIAAMLLLGAFSCFVIRGFVGVVLGVLVLGMAVFLALIPHLEFMTGGRPAVRVDARGIEIARWGRLLIPWSVVAVVGAHSSTRTQTNVIMGVSASFYADHLATRPALLRIADRAMSVFTGPAFVIPPTTRANPETLATWLADEAERRQPAG